MPNPPLKKLLVILMDHCCLDDPMTWKKKHLLYFLEAWGEALKIDSTDGYCSSEGATYNFYVTLQKKTHGPFALDFPVNKHEGSEEDTKNIAWIPDFFTANSRSGADFSLSKMPKERFNEFAAVVIFLHYKGNSPQLCNAKKLFCEFANVWVVLCSSNTAGLEEEVKNIRKELTGGASNSASHWFWSEEELGYDPGDDKCTKLEAFFGELLTHDKPANALNSRETWLLLRDELPPLPESLAVAAILRHSDVNDILEAVDALPWLRKLLENLHVDDDAPNSFKDWLTCQLREGKRDTLLEGAAQYLASQDGSG